MFTSVFDPPTISFCEPALHVEAVDDDGYVHNASEGDRDGLGRIGWRLAKRIPRAEEWFRRDAEACGRDARAPHRANTDPQRNSIFAKGPAGVLDHATSEIAIGSKPGIDATKKLPGEGFKRSWPPLIKMDEATRRKVDLLFGNKAPSHE